MSKKRNTRKNKKSKQINWVSLCVIGFIVIAIFLIITLKQNSQTSSFNPINGISCSDSEGSAVHYHVHLSVYINGKESIIPANIGVNEKCLYWVHTHDTTGIIHIESPVKDKIFTLKDFYDIYGKSLKFNDSNMKIFVNGELYKGNPNNIVLTQHEQIVIEYGPNYLKQIPIFQFPLGT